MRTRRVRGLGLGPRWIVSAVVPWMLASGLLVSFTATAGTDATLGPERLLTRDVAVTGALASSTAWSPDVIEAGLVAPGAPHEAEPGEDGLPTLADSDGATPATPRAVALSSVTPAPADATPIEVAASNLALPGFSARLDRNPSVLDPQISTPEGKSHYADLINPDAMDRDRKSVV